MSTFKNTRAAVALSIALVCALNPLAVLAVERVYSPSQDGHELDKNYYPQKPAPTAKSTDSGVTLQGGVEYTVPKGTPIKMKLTSVPTSGLRLMDRDLEGELRPAKTGMQISATTTEDIFVDTNRVIPEGTTLSGYVSEIMPPRRMYRPGWVKIKFETLKLPDGRKFEFAVNADNFKPSTKKTKAKGAGRLASYAAGGAIVGTMIAYQVTGGIRGTISMHGYNLAAGAALGAVAATTYAAMKKGKAAVLEPGDDLNMNIDADLLMPVATKPTPKKRPKQLAGLDVEVMDVKQVNDGLGGKYMRVDLKIDNNSQRRLRSTDFYLQDALKNMEPISVSNGDEDAQMWFEIAPYSVEKKRIAFSMEYPKLKHKLVILDHASRKIVHEIEL